MTEDKMTVEESTRRLRVLVDRLREVHANSKLRKTWLFADWFYHPDLEVGSLPIETREAKEVPCGTQACAMGHACYVPEFRELGLQLNNRGIPTMKYSGAFGAEAGAELFGISSSAAYRLFIRGPEKADGKRVTPLMVAKEIEEYIRVREIWGVL